MTAVTGSICDVCKAFTIERDGWLKVQPYAEATGDKCLDVCSNNCLIKLGRERMEAGVGTNKPQPGRKRVHKEGET